jgi:hypothetical protein
VSKKESTSRKLVPVKKTAALVPGNLLADVRTLIEQARDATTRAVNSALVMLYWNIGDRIRRDILREKRAEYGKQILGTLSQELSADYGKGYTADNLSRMVKLAELLSSESSRPATRGRWSSTFAGSTSTSANPRKLRPLA